jgi:3-methyladenine DNA glycosylase/8-oxoguanine DNA glycosylase
VPVELDHTVAVDRCRRGAVATRPCRGRAVRGEPGPAGPLLLEAKAELDGTWLAVWGPRQTPQAASEAALLDAAAWAGLTDDPEDFAELVAGHRLLRRLSRHFPGLRLSRLPRIGEALGRAVVAQLVQSVEARRSTAQLVAMAGTAGPDGHWAWPDRGRLGATPAWRMRRCGISLRGARALHAGAVAERRLSEVEGDWSRLDRRLQALPGVGVWTSAQVRLARGDPDAVSVGDYNLPGLVGFVLAGEPTDDAGMLELLAPFAPHRGRVIRLLSAAAAAGLVTRPPRRAPRAALSAHRYW